MGPLDLYFRILYSLIAIGALLFGIMLLESFRLNHINPALKKTVREALNEGAKRRVKRSEITYKKREKKERELTIIDLDELQTESREINNTMALITEDIRAISAAPEEPEYASDIAASSTQDLGKAQEDHIAPKSIEALQLPTRTTHVLLENGIKTVDDLRTVVEGGTLRDIKGVGKKTEEQIISVLQGGV